MSFKIGEIVHVLDEDLSGHIVGINNDLITIRCPDGFDYVYKRNQIVSSEVNEDPIKNHSDFELEENLISIKNETKDKGDVKFKGQKPEFDLHIDELAPDRIFKNKHDALEYQLSFVSRVMEDAFRNNIKNIVFIHGVGKGRLREELRRYLKESYPKVEFFDGDFRKYGHGATEIIIHKA